MKEYKKAEIEVIEIDSEDIIVTSGECPWDSGIEE